MHPRRLRCSSLKYSRYCTPPCTGRTVGAPLCGRRTTPPGPHGADCAPCGGSAGRLARLGATPDFHHGLLPLVEQLRLVVRGNGHSENAERAVVLVDRLDSSLQHGMIRTRSVPELELHRREAFLERISPGHLDDLPGA